jgi:ketosteroid isomerase-like protein
MRQTGAMEQLTEAFREAVITSRDTAKAINDTASELQRRGVIKETASAIMETAESTRMAYETVKSSAAIPESQRKPSETGVEGMAQ